MKLFTRSALIAATALTIAAPSMAAQIADGTVSISNLNQVAVSYGSDPSSVTFNPNTSGFFAGFNTLEIAANGGFASANGGAGNMIGTLNFSMVEGTTIASPLANFFTFGNFKFSVDTVKTTSYSVSGTSQNFALYLLGSTVGTGVDLSDPTATSLTISFQQTTSGTTISGFSASSSLAVPPTPVVTTPVPEAATWAMMVGGFGLLGAALRRKRAVAVTFG